MEKAWNWLIDKKTNTMRRWRSSNIRSSAVAEPPSKSPSRHKKDRATKMQKTMGTLPPDLLLDQLGVHSGGRSSSNMELARTDMDDRYENGGGGGGHAHLLSVRSAMKRTQSCVEDGHPVIIAPPDDPDDDEDSGRLQLADDLSGSGDDQTLLCCEDDRLTLDKRRSRVTFDLKPEAGVDNAAATTDGDRREGADFERFFDQSQPAIEEALKERNNSITTGQAPSVILLASARLSIDEEYPEGPPDSEWNRPLIEQVVADATVTNLGRRKPHDVPTIGDRSLYSNSMLNMSPHDESDLGELDLPTSSSSFRTSSENLYGDKSGSKPAYRTHSLSVPDTGSICSGLSPSSSPMDPRRQSLALRRQSNIQLVQKMTRRRGSTTTIIPLTAPQIHMVRTIWKQIHTSKGPTVLGSTIFHKLFFKSPGIKDAFRQTPIPPHHANYDSFMKAHYKSLADLVDLVICNLENLDLVAADLQEIGRIHAHVLDNGLPTKFWNVLAETFIDSTLEWGDRRSRTETVRKAWALIIAFMVEKIKNGHTEERRALSEAGLVLGAEATYFRDTR